MNFQEINRIATYRVLLLACAGFIFNTTEFTPIALLSDIGASFGKSAEDTSFMITLYAWLVALCSLPCLLLTVKIERKRLLLALFAIFILSHIMTIFAWDFKSLLIARSGVAIAHSVFWAITTALVMRVAPRHRKTQAIAIFAMGVSLASVLGLPLGRLIGQIFNWRATFAVIALIAGIIMYLLYKLLPTLPSKNAGDLRSLPIILKRPALLCLYALTLITISAHFISYSYIEPYALNIAKLSPEHTTFILLFFGCASIFGGLIFNQTSKHLKQHLLPLALFVVCLSTLFLLKSSAQNLSYFINLALWGIAFMGVILSFQINVLKLAPDATDVASSIYSAIFNIGIGSGALLGAQIIKQSKIENLGYGSALLLALATALALYLNHLTKQKKD